MLFGLTQAAFAKVTPKILQDYSQTDSQGLSQADQQAALASRGASDSQLEELTKEMQKDKELLGIWKDHVRTLTLERDEAYKEIESLKNQGATASNPEDPSREAAIREKEDALRQLNYLKDQMTLLEKKYNSLQSAASQNEAAQVDASQLTALQEKAGKLKAVEKELHETRDYFSSYMKDLDAKNKKVLEENDLLKSQLQIAQAEKQKQKEQAQESKQLRTENEKLKKMQAYQSKMIDDQDAKSKKLLEENDLLKSQLQIAQAEKQKQKEQAQELTQLRTENGSLQKLQAQQSKTIRTLKYTIQSSLDLLNSESSDQQK